MLQADYTKIWNIVPHDHLETISWLQKLGFTVAEEYISLKNIPMLYFSRCNKEKSMTTVH
jgi:ribosomal protein S18 acetylase RimI-like enzyme